MYSTCSKTLWHVERSGEKLNGKPLCLTDSLSQIRPSNETCCTAVLKAGSICSNHRRTTYCRVVVIPAVSVLFIAGIEASLKQCLHRLHSESFATAMEFLVVISAVVVVSH